MRRLDSARDFARWRERRAGHSPFPLFTVTDRPTRFKRPVLLIVGCGDVGLRVARLLGGRWRVLALTSSAARVAELRARGRRCPCAATSTGRASLGRLAGLADVVLHLAPPPAGGAGDPRTRRLLAALARSPRLRPLVYASTSGVYGDRGGARTDETRAARSGAPTRAPPRRCRDARLRHFGRAARVAVTLLRVPGIYALDRAGGDPRERLARGTPVLAAADDVHTSHIHADDLARACVAALHRGLPQRVVNVADDSALKMGDYFDLVADRFGLARPPRLARAEAAAVLSPLQMSFLGESRRLDNARLKRELRLVLRYPTVVDGLGVAAQRSRGRRARIGVMKVLLATQPMPATVFMDADPRPRARARAGRYRSSLDDADLADVDVVLGWQMPPRPAGAAAAAALGVLGRGRRREAALARARAACSRCRASSTTSRRPASPSSSSRWRCAMRARSSSTKRSSARATGRAGRCAIARHRVGVLGTGAMGGEIARWLERCGLVVRGWNRRSPERSRRCSPRATSSSARCR